MPPEVRIDQEREPLDRILEAQAMTREALAPFAERVEIIKETVGVALREAARVRTETKLPDGLAVELPSGEIELPEDVATRDSYVVLRQGGQQKIRESAEEVGIGRTRDITLTDLGMSRRTQINIEGGRVFSKLRAEIEQALEQGEGPIVATLSRSRELDAVDRKSTRMNLLARGTAAIDVLNDPRQLAQGGPAARSTVLQHIDTLLCLEDVQNQSGEAATVADGSRWFDDVGRRIPRQTDRGTEPYSPYQQRVLNMLDFLHVDMITLQNEYDGGVLEIMSQPDFVVNPHPVVLGHIDVHGNPSFGAPADGASGELIEIGTIHGRPVYVQEVPQELVFKDGAPVMGDNGKQKFVQPNCGEILYGTSSLLETDEAVVATSNSYYPSRNVQVMLDATYRDAIDQQGAPKRFGVIAYSPDRLARVQHLEPSEVVMSLGHLLGEVKMADIELAKVDARFQRDRALYA